MTASRRTDNLPAPLTTFVGRRPDVGEIGAALERARLVTLTGAGGAGKSRLALEVANRRTAHHRDGVWLVELAGLVDPVLVAHTVAGVLDVPEQRGGAQIVALTERLRGSDMLICLDNCEHLLDPVAQLVQDLLVECRGLRVLITSRERLGVTGETLWPVAGLSVPPDGADEAGNAQGFDAVRLFLDRAIAADPGFRLTEENAPAVADICRRLDGLPLAIELAAARVNSLGVERISRRLDNRFGLLAASSRAALPHHRTLRGVVEWSYRMLSDPERELFDRLAVFSGDFGTEAAEAVSDEPDGPGDVAELLPRLIDKSLVTVTPVRGSPRYRVLETLRAYGLERLGDADAIDPLRARHAAYYVDLAERAWEGYRGPEQPDWLNRLETEHSNLRAALDWQLATHDIEGALRLAGALAPYWDLRGHYAEGHVWLERALSADAATSIATSAEGRVRALNGLATLAVIEGDLPRAARACSEAVELSRRGGDLQGLAYALQYLGFAAVCADDLDRAVDVLEESLTVARESADLWLTGWSYQFLTAAQLARNDFERARALAEAAYATLQETGEPESLAWAALTHAMATWALGGSNDTVARVSEALRRFWVLKAKWGLSEVFCLTGLYTAGQGNWARGAGLLGASESLRDSVGVALMPFVREFMATVATEGRVALGARHFDGAWERGRGWSIDAAALAVTEELGLPPLQPYDGEQILRAVDTGEPSSDGAALRREGEYWAIAHGDQVFRLKDTRGLGYLNRLLHEPDREFLALELAGAGSEPIPSDAGSVLDARAKTEYRNRLRELTDDLQEAEQWNDAGRAERARTEIDALTEQLAGAVGLGGRDRKAASATERARLNVTKALRSVVRRITREDPVLGRHLDRSLRTGTYCCYAPDPATRITWRF
ncbi:ATP-binding protein [Streptomyces sp. SAS_270]|uniref:ATP-binding protein n=1 Tax=Streptomyces sp. SAS_270 TaxID=3412748 RepID=UPI00403D2239